MRVLPALVALLGLLAAGPAASAGPPGAPSASERGCPQACTMIYEPVTCHFAGGATMTFGNRCTAEAYACRHGLRIVSCGAKVH